MFKIRLALALFILSAPCSLLWCDVEAPPTQSNAAIRAYNEGVHHLNAHEFDAAVGSLDQALAADDHFAEAYFLRAICKQSLNSLDAAAMDLDEAIQIKPSLVDAHALRGAIRYEKDQWDSALEDFNYVLSKRPQDGQSLLGRGIIRLNRKDPAGAGRDLRTFVRLYPSHALTPKVREILTAIKKEAGPEEPGEENAGAAPTAPERSQRASRASEGPSAVDLAKELMRRDSSLSERFGRRVLRGERTEMTGDIETRVNTPASRRQAPKEDAIEIVEPK
jgi:tetratricopeptide (TPR) repeat protein